MDDDRLLARIKGGDSQALEAAVDKYSAYICTIIRGRAGGALTREDVEEAASDVFLTLWSRADTVTQGRLRPWLGAVARNKAHDRLRGHGPDTLPLDEGIVLVDDSLWEQVERTERETLARRLLDSLESQDREIFLRYYNLCQPTSEIAQAMGMNQSTVKTRLHRGREKLRQILYARGITK